MSYYLDSICYNKLYQFVKTGSTLKRCTALAIDFTSLTKYFFSSSGCVHFRTIEHWFLAVVFKNELEKYLEVFAGELFDLSILW